MELKEAIYNRRSVRKYKDRPISKDVLLEIMDAACFAPSGSNLQPWYFVVCESEESRKKLSRIVGGSIFHLRKVLESRFQAHPEIIEETIDFVQSMGNAPVCVLAFLQRDNYDVELPAIESVSAAVQNLLLTAHAKGISSCWLTAMLSADKELREAFAPDKGRFMAMVTLGYSDEEPRTPKRKDGRVVII